MRARAAEYGGHVEITSRPGGGTRVCLTIPPCVVNPGDAKTYGRRAVGWGILAVYFLVMSVYRSREGTGVYFPLLVFNVVAFGREFVAYRRTRKLQEARR
jgi:hypothetical protein